METITIQQEKVVNPARIMEVGMGFWASKTLLAAIKLELFTAIGNQVLTGEEIREKLNLNQRSLYDWLDTLVTLGFLRRTGLKETAFYENTEETALFLDKNKPSYLGGILEMANDRLYPFWGALEEGLQTGKPQNEAKTDARPIFEVVYEDPNQVEMFLDAMGSHQVGNFRSLAQKFPFEQYGSLCDIGGANATLGIQVAQQHPHLQIISADLPPVAPVANRNVRNFGLEHQIEIRNLDMFTESFPEAEIITMGNILHDWNVEEKKLLIRKAWEALSENGALIVIENIIDDQRQENLLGLLMSLNMLIETEGGFDYSHADFREWALEAGFKKTTKISLGGPASAVIAFK